MSFNGLVIVQNRVTQFDAPLYALIHQAQRFPISIIYTTPTTSSVQLDSELGFTPGWDHLSSYHYPHRTLKSTKFTDIWQLATEISSRKPSLVVISGYYPRSHLLLAILLRLRGQRIGLRSDNTLAHTTFNGLRGLLRRIVIGRIQRLFHTWHPVGEQAYLYMRSLSQTDRPTYRFAYAVDNEWFARKSVASRADRSAFLQRHGWPDDSYVVLGIMKWAPREDPLTLVSAFAQIAQNNPRLRLILVGDGPLREVVREACSSLGDKVWLPGYVSYSQLPEIYGLANIFVHPAPNEPWGVSVTEALACGLPVLAAEGVGAAHEVLTTPGCGALFPNSGVTALAQLLETYARDGVVWSQPSVACQQAADRWNYRLTIQAFEKALAAS